MLYKPKILCNVKTVNKHMLLIGLLFLGFLIRLSQFPLFYNSYLDNCLRHWPHFGFTFLESILSVFHPHPLESHPDGFAFLNSHFFSIPYIGNIFYFFIIAQAISTAGIYFLYKMNHTAINHKAYIIVLLATISPFFVDLSRAYDVYFLSLFLFIINSYLFSKLILVHNVLYKILYLISSFVFIYVSYYAIFAYAAQVVFLLLIERNKKLYFILLVALIFFFPSIIIISTKLLYSLLYPQGSLSVNYLKRYIINYFTTPYMAFIGITALIGICSNNYSKLEKLFLLQLLFTLPASISGFLYSDELLAQPGSRYFFSTAICITILSGKAISEMILLVKKSLTGIFIVLVLSLLTGAHTLYVEIKDNFLIVKKSYLLEETNKEFRKALDYIYKQAQPKEYVFIKGNKQLHLDIHGYASLLPLKLNPLKIKYLNINSIDCPNDIFASTMNNPFLYDDKIVFLCCPGDTDFNGFGTVHSSGEIEYCFKQKINFWFVFERESVDERIVYFLNNNRKDIREEAFGDILIYHYQDN